MRKNTLAKRFSEWLEAKDGEVSYNFNSECGCHFHQFRADRRQRVSVTYYSYTDTKKNTEHTFPPELCAWSALMRNEAGRTGTSVISCSVARGFLNEAIRLA